MDFWGDLSTLFVVVQTQALVGRGDARAAVQLPAAAAAQHAGAGRRRARPSLPLDEVAKGWAFLRFASFFVGNVKNVYSQWL